MGNDTLDGKAGGDTLTGGAGDDTYVVDAATDVVVELTGEGTDTVNSAVTLSLAGNVENLTLTGFSAINGTGNAADNTLTGNNAANVLTGGLGNDVLDGKGGAKRPWSVAPATTPTWWTSPPIPSPKLPAKATTSSVRSSP